jgi:hypothetical protein
VIHASILLDVEAAVTSREPTDSAREDTRPYTRASSTLARDNFPRFFTIAA